MTPDETSGRLRDWFATVLPPGAERVRVDGLGRLDFGHSSETLLLTVGWRGDGVEQHRDVVLRVRPPEPGLLPPYDFARQFRVLRALEPTPVRAPKALWFEGTGDVLGREFYVMERLDGTVYEIRVPREVSADPTRVRRMTEAVVDQIAAIHTVDLHETGLDGLADGGDHLDRELRHWASEIARVRRGPLPALDDLVVALRERRPGPCPHVTLVHGDVKPGNFAFVDDDVSAVFDWEMTTVGDPLTDIGWAESLWGGGGGGITRRSGALTADELVARYESLTGIAVRNRAWYRALAHLKTAVILLVGAMLVDAGHSDDPRFALMAEAIHPITLQGFAELGLTATAEPGPVTVREERLASLRTDPSGVT